MSLRHRFVHYLLYLPDVTQAGDTAVVITDKAGSGVRVVVLHVLL